MNIFKIKCLLLYFNISYIFSSLMFLKSGSVCELYVFKVIIRMTFFGCL